MIFFQTYKTAISDFSYGAAAIIKEITSSLAYLQQRISSVFQQFLQHVTHHPDSQSCRKPPSMHDIGKGISNAGNSCYMAATLQALVRIPQVANKILSVSPYLTELLSKPFGVDCSPETLSIDQTKELRSFFYAHGWNKERKENLEGDAKEFFEFLAKFLKVTPISITTKKKAPLVAGSEQLLIVQAYSGDTTMQELVASVDSKATQKIYRFRSAEEAPVVLPITVARRLHSNPVNISQIHKLTMPICSSDTRISYTLRSVIIYTGKGTADAHYYTLVPRQDGDWVEYNDSLVRIRQSSDVERVLHSQGYIYLYEQDR